MNYKQPIVGHEIELFTNIYVEIVKKMVRDFNTRICTLDFGSLFVIVLVK